MPTLSKPKVVLAGLLLSILSAAAADKRALRSLVEAENNFARTSVERGIRASFLQFFAENSIIFAPEPKNGKKFYTYYEDKGLKLMWRPIFATIAASDELGVTTGPWEMQKSKTDSTPIAFGDFLSVWRKQADGAWKVIVDVGVDHPQPGGVPVEPEVLPPSEVPADVSLDALRRVLEEAEAKLGERLQHGAADALLAAASDNIRVLRQNSLPAVGREAAKRLLSTDDDRMTRKSDGAAMSDAGDLAYRYGSYARGGGNGAADGYYLTIWRTEPNRDWKIIVDLQKKAAVKK
jgi:ketosteroid isomerase-like protein